MPQPLIDPLAIQGTFQVSAPLLRIRLELGLQRRKLGEGRIGIRLLFAPFGTRTLVAALFVTRAAAGLARTLAIMTLAIVTRRTAMPIATIRTWRTRSAMLAILGGCGLLCIRCSRHAFGRSFGGRPFAGSRLSGRGGLLIARFAASLVAAMAAMRTPFAMLRPRPRPRPRKTGCKLVNG